MKVFCALAIICRLWEV